MIMFKWHTLWARLSAKWWGIRLGSECRFIGQPRFHRLPGSTIKIGAKCEFRSSGTSNLLGINHPCIFSTLSEEAVIDIGSGCGFSGTSIGCAVHIAVGDNVRCGANTLITDTDWHTEDPRTGPNAPIVIEDNVWLSANVTILKGVTIGKNTVVAAGSVVTKSLPADVVAAGVPAMILKKIRGDGQ